MRSKQNNGITRRDYLNGTLLGSGALLLGARCPAQALSELDWDGYGGVGDYSHSNGNTYAVMAEGHRLRDAGYDLSARNVVETGERYDCVVAGGGISGLSAALFHQRLAHGNCLVIDDHAIFGGLAKRNELLVDGRRVIANQASAMYFPQFEGSFLDGFYKSIGIDDRQFVYQKWSGGKPEMPVGKTPYFEGDQTSGFFFGKKFGQSPGVWVTNPWEKNLKGAPIPDEARRELLRTQNSAPEKEPQNHGDAISRHLDSISLEQHLIDRFAISKETVRTFLSPVAGGGSGIGADALSAYADYAADVLFPYDKKQGPQMFPGGNAGVARHILKAILPEGISGAPTMQGICRGTVQFARLDRPGQPTRIRLRATIVSIQPARDSTRIIYSQAGKLYSVMARSVVVASGSWTAKYIVRDLPASHAAAYEQFYRAPAMVANVAVRNWNFLYKLGITQAQWFEGIGNYTAVRKLATFGDISPTLSPDSPVVLTMKILFSRPGLSLAEQVKRGRAEMLATSYANYEQQIKALFSDMFGGVGFDADRDIAGIVLNRWGHAYLAAQPGFFFGLDGKPAPGEVLRNQPVGRTAFANSDVTGIMDHRASIQEAHRAVKQCMEA